MASIAYDNDAGYPARLPVSAHPAFPAIVALWFSSLLGLGSMVLPAVLVERGLAMTGLSALVPALSAPLDLPGRGIVALAAGVIGALLGIAIARRVAAAHEPAPAPRFARYGGSGPRRPISVNEELGGERVINGYAPPVTRRRALAITEDERPSDFLYRAPLPGEAPFDPTVTRPAADEPLELSDVLVEEPEQPLPPEPFASDEDDAMTDRQEFRPLASFAAEPDPAPEPEFGTPAETAPPAFGGEPLKFAAPSLARRVDHHLDAAPQPAFAEPAPAPEWAQAAPESLGLVQLVQRLGSSLERRRAALAAAGSAPAARPLAVPEAFEAAPAEEAAQAMAAYFGHSDGASADEPAIEAPPVPVEPEPMSPVVSSRPDFLRAFPVTSENEDDEDDDPVPSFSLPLSRSPVLPAMSGADVEEDEEESAEADEESDYGSLLAMRNPFTGSSGEFVRIDDEPEDDGVEPAVVFPEAHAAEAVADQPEEAPSSRLFDPPGKAAAPAAAAPPPVPADADAALRAALATLQRMSGAA